MDGRPIRSISLIIPAFNEAAGICQAIAEADEALAKFAEDYEILVVDDGSTDVTAGLVTEVIAANPRVTLLRHPENQGYSAALRTGFESARGELVAFTDADSQFNLEELGSLACLAADAQVAVGYRVNRQDPWHRRFFSWGYNALVRALLGTGVRDCDCALKVFRKQALTHLLPQSRGYFVNAEMLTRARQQGCRVAEMGVTHRPRMKGVSKVSLLEIPKTLATLLPFWWSQVLFPKTKVTTQHSSALSTQHSALFFLVLAAALLCFTRLKCPLLEPDEARYAEIPRQMLAEGKAVVPVLHGQPYYHKPPLLYWLVMGSYQVFGVHDWAARLVPCTAVFLTVLVTFWWGRRTVSWGAALAGALILCLSSRFIYLGRMLTMDGLLGLCVVTSLAAAHGAVRNSLLNRKWWLFSALACGLGVLTKGPVALLLVAVPVFVYQMLDVRSARPRSRSWLAYLGVVMAVAAPWYLAVGIDDPRFFSEFFWIHNLRRFVDPLDHEGPIWYYLPSVFLGMLPWTLLLPGLVKFLVRKSAAAEARRSPALGFFVIASLWSLVFFSLSGCKRPGYILPALPPLALAMGYYLDCKIKQRWRLASVPAGLGSLRLHPLGRLAYQATVLVLALGVGGSLLAIPTDILKPVQGLGLAVAMGIGLAIMVRRGPAHSLRGGWTLCAAVTFGLMLTAVHQLLPGYARKFSLRAQVRRQLDLADRQVPVVCYPRRWDSVSFYLKHNDVRTYSSESRTQLMTEIQGRPETLVFIKSDRSLRDFLRDLPEDLEFEQRGRQGSVIAGLVRARPEVLHFMVAQAEH